MAVEAFDLDQEMPDELIPVHSWPTLNDKALQGKAGELVRMLEPTTEADPVAILLCLLTVLGVWVEPGPHIRVANEKHPPLLWLLITGGTSNGAKGTAWSLARLITATADPIFTTE